MFASDLKYSIHPVPFSSVEFFEVKFVIGKRKFITKPQNVGCSSAPRDINVKLLAASAATIARDYRYGKAKTLNKVFELKRPERLREEDDDERRSNTATRVLTELAMVDRTMQRKYIYLGYREIHKNNKTSKNANDASQCFQRLLSPAKTHSRNECRVP